MHLFLDSSALAKRYLLESGSEKVIEECKQATEISLSILAVPEIISGFNRLKREGKASKNQYDKLKKSLLKDIEEASLIQVTPSVIQRAIVCLEESVLRTLDAIQIASAFNFPCDLFLTADLKQLTAARKLHLKTLYVGI